MLKKLAIMMMKTLELVLSDFIGKFLMITDVHYSFHFYICTIGCIYLTYFETY